MVTDRSRKRLPPYVSYRTFWNFVLKLQEEGIPARIDRSYWEVHFSGSTGNQLVAALRFLGLMDTDDLPTGRLKTLVSSKAERRTEVLKEIAADSYSFLLSGSFDSQKATYSQLGETFRNAFNLTDDVNRKCIKFFVALANDAKIPLSPFITKRFRETHSNPVTKKVSKSVITKNTRKTIIPKIEEELPESMSRDKLLLSKFPTFDPSWTDDVKLKWFDAFDELLRRGKVQE